MIFDVKLNFNINIYGHLRKRVDKGEKKTSQRGGEKKSNDGQVKNDVIENDNYQETTVKKQNDSKR